MKQTSQKILWEIFIHPNSKASEVFLRLGNLFSSERTFQRDLKGLVEEGFLSIQGGGRSTSYSLSENGARNLPVDMETYFEKDITERDWAEESFLITRLAQMPTSLFSTDELEKLNALTGVYEKRSKEYTQTLHQKELERFVIELSWKSAKIEGNTYTLLDTEQLIKYGVRSDKNTENEAQMILNHKVAFDAIFKNKKMFAPGVVTIQLFQEIHKLIVADLGIATGIRKSPVGISGSVYKPAEFESQIQEGLKVLLKKITEMTDVYSVALLVLLGISYIQAFEDGNKRTARMLANAFLLQGQKAMLSYRTVDEQDYKERMLVFYEVGSLAPMKELFLGQYEYAAQNYARKLDL